MKVQKAIITSGPTKEWIDPVRFITNASSGKMGHTIATHVSSWVDEIIYIHGPVCSEYATVPHAKNISIETTTDLMQSVLAEISDNTLLIMAAAPADFRPSVSAESKIKKETSANDQTLHLIKNPDILIQVSEYVKEHNLHNVTRIGFAAETDDLEKHALDKLARKNLELVIGNHVYKNDRGFGDIDSEISVFSAAGQEVSFNGNKSKIGKELSDFIQKYLLQK